MERLYVASWHAAPYANVSLTYARTADSRPYGRVQLLVSCLRALDATLAVVVGAVVRVR